MLLSTTIFRVKYQKYILPLQNYKNMKWRTTSAL